MKKIPFLVLLLIVMAGNTRSANMPETMAISHDTTIVSGPYALIAGGSKGIGYALAVALARRQYNLVLIARHLDSLRAAKQKLESAYGIHVELLVNDLSREESANEIADWCNVRNIPPENAL